jgi:hypothetical protein
LNILNNFGLLRSSPGLFALIIFSLSKPIIFPQKERFSKFKYAKNMPRKFMEIFPNFSLKILGHLQISWSKYFMKAWQGAEGKADCAASIGGILLSITPRLAFRKAQRGRERKSSEDKRTLPP